MASEIELPDDLPPSLKEHIASSYAAWAEWQRSMPQPPPGGFEVVLPAQSIPFATEEEARFAIGRLKAFGVHGTFRVKRRDK